MIVVDASALLEALLRSILLALVHSSNRVRVICEGEPRPHCAMRTGSIEQPESALHYAVSPFRDRDAGVVVV